MNAKRATITWAALSCCAQLVLAQPDNPSEGTQGPLDHALTALHEAYVFGAHQPTLIGKCGEAFDQALASIASPADQPLAGRPMVAEGPSIDTKLRAIAAHRRAQPELYTEIERIYILGVDNPRRRAPRSPRVATHHATEPYRLAWEYFLLRPPPHNASSYHDHRISQTLIKIGNPSSLLTLCHAYRVTTEEGIRMTRRLENRQRLLLATIGQFPTRAGLDGMADCLAWSSKQAQRGQRSQRRPGQFTPPWDPKAFALRLLTDQENYGTRAAWQRTLTSYPPTQHSPSTSNVLQKALNAYREADTPTIK